MYFNSSWTEMSFIGMMTNPLLEIWNLVWTKRQKWGKPPRRIRHSRYCTWAQQCLHFSFSFGLGFFRDFVQGISLILLAVIDYVEQIKELLFSMTKEERETIMEKYKGKIPGTLTNQFPGRASKETAIGRHEARKQLRTELFSSGKILNIKTIKKFKNSDYLDLRHLLVWIK